MRSAAPFLFAALFATAPAWAEAPANAEPLPDIPPPSADTRPFDDSIEEPQITIRKEERGTVEEYRLSGKLYMVKITPEVGAPYYLVDNDGDGHFETHSPTDSGMRVPMWVIGTF